MKNNMYMLFENGLFSRHFDHQWMIYVKLQILYCKIKVFICANLWFLCIMCIDLIKLQHIHW